MISNGKKLADVLISISGSAKDPFFVSILLLLHVIKINNNQYLLIPLPKIVCITVYFLFHLIVHCYIASPLFQIYSRVYTDYFLCSLNICTWQFLFLTFFDRRFWANDSKDIQKYADGINLVCGLYLLCKKWY